MLHRLLTLFACLLTAMTGSAQQVLSRTTVLPAEGLQQDVKDLRTVFEQLHPGLYRYNTRQQMDAVFDRLANDFTRDLSLESTFLRLSAFTAEVRCGHTYPSFFNQSDAVTAALFQSTNRLSFFFRWKQGKMVVTQDFTADHSVRPGSVIASVNGIPAANMLRRLLPLVRETGRMTLSGLTSSRSRLAPTTKPPTFCCRWSFRTGQLHSIFHHDSRDEPCQTFDCGGCLLPGAPEQRSAQTS